MFIVLCYKNTSYHHSFVIFYAFSFICYWYLDFEITLDCCPFLIKVRYTICWFGFKSVNNVYGLMWYNSVRQIFFSTLMMNVRTQMCELWKWRLTNYLNERMLLSFFHSIFPVKNEICHRVLEITNSIMKLSPNPLKITTKN